MRLGAVLALTMTTATACGSSPSSPSKPPLPVSAETEHYVMMTPLVYPGCTIARYTCNM